jgi:hypothetical protein
MIPVMTRIIANIDLKPVIKEIKECNVFDEKEKPTKEQNIEFAFQLFSVLAPQLDKIGADIPEFVSLYKGVSIAEANEMDITEIIKDLSSEKGIVDFFKRALQKKVEQ